MIKGSIYETRQEEANDNKTVGSARKLQQENNASRQADLFPVLGLDVDQVLNEVRAVLLVSAQKHDGDSEAIDKLLNAEQQHSVAKTTITAQTSNEKGTDCDKTKANKTRYNNPGMEARQSETRSQRPQSTADELKIMAQQRQLLQGTETADQNNYTPKH